jgi:hypothetical protein
MHFSRVSNKCKDNPIIKRKGWKAGEADRQMTSICGVMGEETEKRPENKGCWKREPKRRRRREKLNQCGL